MRILTVITRMTVRGMLVLEKGKMMYPAVAALVVHQLRDEKRKKSLS
jgi:hypothetical protein